MYVWTRRRVFFSHHRGLSDECHICHLVSPWVSSFISPSLLWRYHCVFFVLKKYLPVLGKLYENFHFCSWPITLLILCAFGVKFRLFLITFNIYSSRYFYTLKNIVSERIMSIFDHWEQGGSEWAGTRSEKWEEKFTYGLVVTKQERSPLLFVRYTVKKNLHLGASYFAKTLQMF